MAQEVCPLCQSKRLRRSRSQGIKEHLLKILNRRAFRCRNCGWRGFLIIRSSKGVYNLLEGYTIKQILLIILVTILTTLITLIIVSFL